ncbi:hypothetical protein IQ07DRAFT_633056 [Pyrenochaeta sp. DS3sAY3a]|nr:hypothetical protein IQ07DRAFT_633056 [Pyrenochaeta sp. DS3sAY3a]
MYNTEKNVAKREAETRIWSDGSTRSKALSTLTHAATRPNQVAKNLRIPRQGTCAGTVLQVSRWRPGGGPSLPQTANHAPPAAIASPAALNNRVQLTAASMCQSPLEKASTSASAALKKASRPARCQKISSKPPAPRLLSNAQAHQCQRVPHEHGASGQNPLTHTPSHTYYYVPIDHLRPSSILREAPLTARGRRGRPRASHCTIHAPHWRAILPQTQLREAGFRWFIGSIPLGTTNFASVTSSPQFPYNPTAVTGPGSRSGANRPFSNTAVEK